MNKSLNPSQKRFLKILKRIIAAKFILVLLSFAAITWWYVSL